MSNSTYGQKKLRTKIASQQGTLVMARNALVASIEITQQRDALLAFWKVFKSLSPNNSVDDLTMFTVNERHKLDELGL